MDTTTINDLYLAALLHRTEDVVKNNGLHANAKPTHADDKTSPTRTGNF